MANKKWEYCRHSGSFCHRGFTTEEILRHCGEEGWELVSVVSEGPDNEVFMYFKRELET